MRTRVGMKERDLKLPEHPKTSTSTEGSTTMYDVFVCGEDDRR